LHGERMPELRSSTRQARLRSRKPDDQKPAEQAAKPALPAPQRAGKRVPPPAIRGRKGAAGRRGGAAPRGRRKAVEVVDLEAGQGRGDSPKPVVGQAVVGEAKNVKAPEVVANKGLRMDGESAEKLVAADDESSLPVPERV
jgi:hypothetical protein